MWSIKGILQPRWVLRVNAGAGSSLEHSRLFLLDPIGNLSLENGGGSEAEGLHGMRDCSSPGNAAVGSAPQQPPEEPLPGLCRHRALSALFSSPRNGIYFPPLWDLGPQHPEGRAGSTHSPHSPRGDRPGVPRADPGDERCRRGLGLWLPVPTTASAINHGDISSGQDGAMTGTIHLRDTRAGARTGREGWHGVGLMVASTAVPLLVAPWGQDPWGDGAGSGVSPWK